MSGRTAMAFLLLSFFHLRISCTCRCRHTLHYCHGEGLVTAVPNYPQLLDKESSRQASLAEKNGHEGKHPLTHKLKESHYSALRKKFKELPHTGFFMGIDVVFLQNCSNLQSFFQYLKFYKAVT
jgi:hypothetical protein